MGLSLRAHS